MNAWLVTESGDRAEIRGSLTIGRSSDNGLKLPGKNVSRKHALVHQQPNGEISLIDFSANGVLVNGRRIRQSVPLRHNDRIEIGSHVLVFHLAPIVPAVKNGPDPSRTARVETDVEICDELVWMLIADLEGSTPLSQKLPGDLFAGLVGRWFASCREIIEGNGGTINKHLGDGFLAYWPSTQIKPDAVAQTLAALKAMPVEDNCSFRVILHYAKVTVDKAVAQSEDTLMGEEVVFIFRAEKIAAKLKERCMISLAAAQELMPYGSVTSLGCHSVQGFPGEYEFFRF